MIRFTSTELRPLLSQQGGMQRPLLLEKNLGIYIRVPDDRNPGEWLRAWAEGCNPSKDANWSENADLLIPGKEYAFQTFMEQSKFDAVLNEHHDLFMMPSAGPLGTGMTIRKETCPPEKVYALVEEYRSNIRWLYDQSLRHLPACVGNAERLSWRSQALSVLDRVIRLDCKRAKPADRTMFESAVRSVRSSVSEVMSDGSFRYAGTRR
ncbi:hypothetical protein [Enterobacter asburiae]|uniref:Uncharacterized protein n=1 Tax=Enterobacter asburiae TaxID=61645 RepID=A0ABU6KNR1_ENTAS|nr:hypothetical protein [Enterobacter asburiae]CZX62369.1 Uncharacterised protein [Enterobacter cloacae]MCK1017790.1 hypothetical protein [Enterobacter asburiae]MDU2340972.1 hypothetical protein [Enterobacter asburiae]MDU7758669.1 hypothetical protein [Enterobacter asburiae]MEC5727281.1 hypothetical protein [Enterobacter asburiae]